MKIEIPGWGELVIKQLLLDYNGTLAVDGQLIDGVKNAINDAATQTSVYVITADTYGSVQQALSGTLCEVITIGEGAQDQQKLDYLRQLGATTTLAVGNGRNDALMLTEAALGIATLQAEGASTQALRAADIVCNNILDVFAYFSTPNRLKATLRN